PWASLTRPSIFLLVHSRGWQGSPATTWILWSGWRSSLRRRLRRSLRRGRIGYMALENPPQDARRQHRQGIDRNIRLVGIAMRRIGDAENPLALFRHQ